MRTTRFALAGKRAPLRAAPGAPAQHAPGQAAATGHHHIGANTTWLLPRAKYAEARHALHQLPLEYTALTAASLVGRR